MPGPREPEAEAEAEPGSAAADEAGPPERITASSLDDAQDEAMRRVAENDARHPPHDDVPTATRDEEE